MQFIKRLLLILVFILVPVPLASVGASPPPMQSVGELWLDIRVLNDTLLDMYNRIAREDDIIRIEHVKDMRLLDRASTGRKLLVFKSAAQAEQLIPRIAGEVDIIGYNLERGPANPDDEKANPVESARRMRALADEYNLALAFGPDHDFALSHGVDIAPYVDIFVLQVQLVQNRPDVVHDFVMPLIPRLRQANPDLEVSIQVRTEARSPEEVEMLVDLVDSIRDSEGYLNLDGVSVLTSKETVNNAERLITELEKRGVEITAATLTARADTSGNTTDRASSAAAAGTKGQEEPTLLKQVSAALPILLACTLSVGVIGGGLAYFLSCASKQSTDR